MVTIDIYDVIERTRKGFFVLDDDTGFEILCFERYYRRQERSIVLCFLRDPDTKRFYKKVNEFMVHYVGVIERCYPNGCRKGKGCSPTNNIHVECHDWRNIDPSDYDSIDDMLNDIQIKLDEMASECTDCFDRQTRGVLTEPDKVDVLFHTIEGGEYECLMDRCEQ